MKNPLKIWLGCLAVAVLLLVGAVLQRPLARVLARHLGARIVSASQGAVADPQQFFQHRFTDAAVLGFLAIGAALLHAGITRALSRKEHSPNRRWIVHALSAFCLVNLWLALAMHTALFWCLLNQGENTQNFARFQLKRLLFAEDSTPRKILLVGNSQVHSEIDARALNAQLAPTYLSADMYFPGSRAYDTRLLVREAAGKDICCVICYVSPLNFYGGQSGDTAAALFNFTDLSELASPARQFVPADGFGYGLLGSALPVFRLRDVLSQRILGAGITQLKQRQYDENLSENLEANAVMMATSLRRDRVSAFQFQSFERSISICERRGIRVVILAGQLNPLVEARLDPDLRRDMLANLRRIRDAHSNVVLIEDLPAHTVAEYVDLTHINHETQARFTSWIAEVLKPVLAN